MRCWISPEHTEISVLHMLNQYVTSAEAICSQSNVSCDQCPDQLAMTSAPTPSTHYTLQPAPPRNHSISCLLSDIFRTTHTSTVYDSCTHTTSNTIVGCLDLSYGVWVRIDKGPTPSRLQDARRDSDAISSACACSSSASEQILCPLHHVLGPRPCVALLKIHTCRFGSASHAAFTYLFNM